MCFLIKRYFSILAKNVAYFCWILAFEIRCFFRVFFDFVIFLSWSRVKKGVKRGKKCLRYGKKRGKAAKIRI